jgi:IS5 family transposase
MRRETLLRFVKLSVAVAEAELPAYSHRFAPHRYRLAQLCACCLLKVLLRQDLRGIEALLSVSPELRKALGLKRVPDHSTLCRFESRWLSAERLDRMLARVCEKAGVKAGAVAADSTGLEASTATPYFEMRRGGRRKAYLKLSLLVALSGLLAVSAVSSSGPSNDKEQLRPLLAGLEQRLAASEFLADAGYDAEWVHEWCRDRHGIESWIPPVIHRRDGKVGGRWRRVMAQGLPEKYGRRWGAETFISGLKRTVGSVLQARSHPGQLAEAILRTLVYNLRR